MGKLDGRVAIVTGGSRGIGEGISRVFAAEGAKVAVCDIDVEGGTRTAKDIGAGAIFVELNVGEEQAWTDAVAHVTEQLGPPTILVNNAGITTFMPLSMLSLQDYLHIITVNQIGTFLGMKSVAAPMAGAGGGAIVNISSIGGLTGMAFVGAYVASKFAITGMTRVAAVEMASAGIRVNAIHPGGVNTPAVTEYGALDVAGAYAKMAPLGRMGEPDEIGRTAMFLSTEDSSYITGASLVVDGGITAGIALSFPTEAE
jgi:3alpha(or 20beta)-hydroxysteroid dehydrogenase